MHKYNKFNIGDVVGHHESPSLKFRIISVLPGAPEEKGSYAYGYSQLNDEDYNEDMDGIFEYMNNGVYIEPDLFFIRKPTFDEMSKMLSEAEIQENWFKTISEEIRQRRNSLLNEN